MRQVISDYCHKYENIQYDPVKEIIVTVGGMEGLYLTFLSILNPGDEVIIPAPYWINYKHMIHLCNGTPVIVDSEPDLSLSVENIKAKITHKTKIIIINTPCNPSGLIISHQALEELAKIAIEKNLTIVTDEVSKTLIYTDEEYKSIVKMEGMRERTVVVNSLSKQFAMTGWRIGYVLAPEELVSVMTKLQENIVACAPLPSQYAAIEALSHANEYSENLRCEFAKRREALITGINAIPLLSCNNPIATFYAMINIKKTQMTSLEFDHGLCG